MSTATRKQLESRVETLGNVVQQMITELQNLRDLAIGTMTLVKELPDYDQALETMKSKVKEEPEEIKN
jgi:hypothetical protein|tara:strand:- start:423 stop:626 length:204 start_codon:yes stop_codon:yes gene_type:complete